MKMLLPYVFPITIIEPTPEASTAFLKQVLVVVNPKEAVPTGVISLCTNMTQVAALTDNTEAQQLFNAGMAKVYVLPMDDLDLATALLGEGEDYNLNDFYTILISSDFSDSDIQNLVDVAAVKASLKVQDILYEAVTEGSDGNDISITYTDDGTGGAETVDVVGDAIEVHMEAGVSTADDIRDAIEASMAASALVTATVDEGDENDVQAAFALDNLEGGVDEVVGDPDAGLLLGDFEGVVGVSSIDDEFLAAQAIIHNRCPFHTTNTNKAKNMFYAFGKLLSNTLGFKNQQYIEVPLSDDVDTLAEANTLFDARISFCLSDDEFGKRLGMFAAGGKAIVAPYIEKNLTIDLQSRALTYISANQPGHTKKEAALIQDELEKVMQEYIDDGSIEAGTVLVDLGDDDFVANASINIAEPGAMWRIFGEMRQTL